MMNLNKPLMKLLKLKKILNKHCYFKLLNIYLNLLKLKGF